MFLPSRKSRMLDPVSFILACIFWAGGIIKGKTRLQKIIFLLQQELGITIFEFKPYRFGPFSSQLNEIIDSLLNQGLLQMQKSKFSSLEEKSIEIVSLTNEGIAKAEQVIESLDNVTRITARILAKHYAMVPLTYLIAYIYAKYPDFTTLSEIKEIVEKWRGIYGLKLEFLSR
jgi:uncharacterized protein YwgA